MKKINEAVLTKNTVLKKISNKILDCMKRIHLTKTYEYLGQNYFMYKLYEKINTKKGRLQKLILKSANT